MNLLKLSQLGGHYTSTNPGVYRFTEAGNNGIFFTVGDMHEGKYRKKIIKL